MTWDELLKSVSEEEAPPDSLSEELASIWHAEKGNWDTAHTIAQGIPSADGSWIHANLHREEGDLGNARYWYARAGRPESRTSIQQERKEIFETLS